jgi:hypothetical protein
VRDHMNTRLRKGMALAVVLIGLLGSSAALGQDPGPCHEAYLQSGLTEQQMNFDHFRHFYSDTLCAPEGYDLQAAREEMR